MHILIAPNAFKNSISATAAANAIEKGLHQSKLSCTTECLPIADGGDGTAELIIQKLKGKYIPIRINDPLRRTIDASFGLIDDGKTAVIAMADASGLRLLKADELDPIRASSYGTGEMMRKALDMGVTKILIAMGGSATVDGATGILSALGIKFFDAGNNELTNMPDGLTDLARVDDSGLDKRIANCRIIVLCDVDNMLLGAQGAASVFGPQKGASLTEVKTLDAALSRFNDVTQYQLGKNMAEVKYGGTAGGASAGVYAWLNAELVNGIDEFMRLTKFDEALLKATLVITGEGSIDEQTLQGKGPYGVAKHAKEKGIPVIGLAGKIPLESNHQLNQYFDILMAIGNQPDDVPTAISNAKENLERTAKAIGEMIDIGLKIQH